LRISTRRTQHVEDVLRPSDLIVAVCDSAHEELSSGPVPARKRLHWAVPDPVRGDTDESFEAAYAEIATRVERLAAMAGEPMT
jgi:protein-tyrosine-phosphatase